LEGRIEYSCAPPSLGSRATPPRYYRAGYSEPAIGCRISFRNYKKIASGVTVAWLNVDQNSG
ncbi:unnamed protein product, partial [Sphenostylis stenocarpa]